MTKLKILAGILAAMTTSANADPRISPAPYFEIINNRPIAVEVVDRATGGCWTNAPETRRAIIEKLKGQMFTAFDAQEKPAPHELTVKLEIVSERSSEGQCLGQASIKLTEVWDTEYRGKPALVQIIAHYINSGVSSYQDHNRQALRLADMFTGQLASGASSAIIYVGEKGSDT